MRFCIYKHTNKINGKSYIGFTSHCLDLKIRCGENGIKYKQQKDFYEDIKKYGWKNFDHEILESNIESEALARERERYWIKFYNSVEKGYNNDYGTKIFLGLKYAGKKIICLETKEIFVSINSAAEKYGVDRKRIKLCLKETYRTCKGLHFVLYSDFNKKDFKIMQKPKKKSD